MERRSGFGIVVILLFTALCGQAQADDSIAIGALVSVTGRPAWVGVQTEAGLLDALQIANEEGGINGKKINYVRQDAGETTDKAVTAFKNMMSTHHPLAVYSESEELTRTIGPDIKDRYKILYSPASMSAEFADEGVNPYIFLAGPTDGDMLAILLKHIARTTPSAKGAFLYSDSAFGKSPIPFARNMCRRLGLTLVGEETVAENTIDFVPQIKRLREKQPDYLIIHGFFLDSVKGIVGQCHVLGFKPAMICTFSAGTRALLRHMGKAAEGLRTISPYMCWWNDDVPMIKKIIAYNKKHYPYVEFRENSYMQGFMTGLIFVECLRRADKAGQLNGEGLVQALKSLKDFDTGGLSAPLTIRNNRFPVARIWQTNVEKEIFEPVSGWIRVELYGALRDLDLPRQ
ncbi:MAG: ABC transporter substrate-binding protein [Thermodesulfobacteriota bacterium]